MPAAATYEPIATTTVSGSAIYTYSFTSIPQTYTDLVLVMAGKSNGTNAVGLQFNNDTGITCSRTNFEGNGSAASSGSATNTDNINFGTMTTQVSLLKVEIFSYTGSTNKTVLGEFSATASSSGIVRRTVGLAQTTSAITSLKLISWFDAGTMITLYGIKAA